MQVLVGTEFNLHGKKKFFFFEKIQNREKM
jgi:hypothetical protein